MLASLSYSYLLFLSTILLDLSQASTSGSDVAKSPVITRIACEGDLLTLNCSDTHVIKLLRANYGRFTLNICNDKGQDWANTQCYWAKTLRTLNDRCASKSYCVVEASDVLFQDNCPETHKYLEAVYECIPNPQATTPNLVVADTIHGISTTTINASTSSIPTTTTTNVPTPTDYHSVETTTDKNKFCPETSAYEILWPATRAGFPCKIGCPNNNASSAYAELFCDSNSQWDFSRLNLSNCLSQWVLDLENHKPHVGPGFRVSKIGKAEEIRLNLDSRTVYGAEPKHIVTAMANILEEVEDANKMRMKMPNSELIGQNLIGATDILLSERNRDAWNYLRNTPNHLETISTMLTLVEQSGFLADPMRLQSEQLSNIDIHVVMVAKNTFEPLKQPGVVNSVSLSPSLIHSRTVNGPSKIVFTKYSNIASMLNPESVWRKNRHKQSQTEVQRKLVTKVLSAAINGTPVQNFDSAVSVTFALDKAENLSNPHCVFWDMSSYKWSELGCKLMFANDTHGICTCNHLTSFAILMDVHGLELDLINELALVTITYGGCIISIVCLFLTILAFQWFKGLHSERATIHKNLCFCLLVAELVFLAGINQTEDRVACGIVAGLLHYFFLAAFTWMLLEGFQLYFLLIEVFEAEKSRRGYFYLFGYGVPTVIVAVSVGIDYHSYGTERSCWLNTENYFVFSFVGPAFVVILANMVFLTMAVIIMCRHSQSKSTLSAVKQDSFSNYGAFVKGAVVLIVLLGLTWSFGLLYVNQGTIIFAYLFTVLNSLQGLFIFLFNIVANDKVKKEYVKLLRRNDWLPSWIRGDITSTESATKSNNQRIPESSSSDTTGLSPQNSTVTTLTSSSSIAKLFRMRGGRKSSRNSTQSLLARNSSNMSKPGRLDLGILTQSNGIPSSYVSYLGGSNHRQLVDPKTGIVYHLARVDCDSDVELSPNGYSPEVLPYRRYIQPPSFPPPPVPTNGSFEAQMMSKSADYSSPSEGYFSQDGSSSRWRSLADNNNSAHLSYSLSFCDDSCRGELCPHSRNNFNFRSPREDSMPTIYEAPSIQSYSNATQTFPTAIVQRHLDNCYAYELDLGSEPQWAERHRNSGRFASVRD